MTWPQPLDPSPFGAHLQPGERVMWSGRPDPRRLFQPADAVMVPFSLLWGGFAIFWETIVLASGAPLGMALFGLPFVLVGLYLIVGRFIHRAWANSRTWYVLTDSRALVVYGAAGQNSRSIDLDRVDDISVTRRADGSGTLVFGRALPEGFAGRNAGVAGTSPMPGWASLARGPLVFANIPDVNTVEGLADSFARDLR